MKPRVLAVDDDAEYSELITYRLAQEGCEVIVAANGLEGLNLARTEIPDVILLDLMLPDLDGFSVIQILRAQPSTRQIPVFIVSALDESWIQKRRKRLRYEKYFKKPVDLKALGESVRAAARKQSALTRLSLAEPSQLYAPYQ